MNGYILRYASFVISMAVLIQRVYTIGIWRRRYLSSNREYPIFCMNNVSEINIWIIVNHLFRVFWRRQSWKYLTLFWAGVGVGVEGIHACKIDCSVVWYWSSDYFWQQFNNFEDIWTWSSRNQPSIATMFSMVVGILHLVQTYISNANPFLTFSTVAEWLTGM